MRILVLEQDNDVRVTVQKMLECSDHVVTSVARPDAALTELSKSQFDVVFTNRLYGYVDIGISLPWMMRAIQPGVAIIVTTNWAVDNTDRVPFDAVLQKPFTVQQIDDTLLGLNQRH